MSTAYDMFISELALWRQRREESFREDFSWLSMSELFWLKDGPQTIGTSADNDHVIHAHSQAPGRLGTLELNNGTLVFVPEAGIEAVLRDESGLETPIVGATVLQLDDEGPVPPSRFRVADLLITGLSRTDKQNGLRYGVRVRDRANPRRREFNGLSWFDPDPDFLVLAKYEGYDKPRRLGTTNVFGNGIDLVSVGRLSFQLKGLDLTLEAAEEDGHLFVNFRDLTSGKSTYGSGRFLHPAWPQGGQVELDFNRAFSPPCAFTPFAICPLPIKANHLPLEVKAGERYQAQ